MNQIIEELKNEGGLIKVRKLSDRKIQLHYKIPIKSMSKIIGYTNIDSIYRLHFDEISFNRLPNKDAFYNRLSMFWKIKKKFISLHTINQTFIIDGYTINNPVISIDFSNITWHRDYLLNKLLTNESRNNS